MIRTPVRTNGYASWTDSKVLVLAFEREDIEYMAAEFGHHGEGFDRELADRAARWLDEHGWPGQEQDS